jgi:hypothetical protein
MRYRLATDNVVDKVLDEEAVIINLDTGMYYGLDGPAAKVWECASRGVPIEQIANELALYYPAQEGIDEELAALLAKLCAAGLLAAAADNEAGDPPVSTEWPQAYQPLDLTCYDDVADMIALDPPLPELSYERLDQPRRAQA